MTEQEMEISEAFCIFIVSRIEFREEESARHVKNRQRFIASHRSDENLFSTFTFRSWKCDEKVFGLPIAPESFYLVRLEKDDKIIQLGKAFFCKNFDN